MSNDDKIIISQHSVKAEAVKAGKADLTEALSEIDAIMGGNIIDRTLRIAEGAAGRTAADAYQRPQSPVGVYSQPDISVGDYMAQMVIKESANGKERVRFQIRTTDGRRATDTEYRHQSVARSVADILNETDDPNDRRIVKLDNLCERESELIAEVNKRRKMLKETPRGNTKKRNILKNFVDNALTEIEDIRSRLGVS